MDSRRSQVEVRRSRSLRGCLALSLATCLLVWRWPGLFSTYEQIAYDTANELRPNPPAVSGVLIVEIDDLSVDPSELGRFPWPRRVFAEIIRQLDGARAIGLDVLFLEPDERDPEGDAELVNAVAESGVVVLPASIQTDRVISEDALLRLDALRAKLATTTDEQLALTGEDPGRFQPPLLELTETAAGVGFANLVEDGDGRYRRVRPCYVGTDARLYPNFACEVARVALGLGADEMYGAYPHAVNALADRPMPLQGGEFWIHYSGPAGTVPRVSAASVYRGQLPSESVAGKIVLIGATAAGLYDIRPAPYRGRGARMYGVETNSMVVNSLLSAPVLRGEHEWTVYPSLVVLGPLAAGLIWWRRIRVALQLAGIGLIVLFGAYLAGFWLWDCVLVLAPRVAIVALCVALALADRIALEARLRERLTDIFASYVAPEVAESLARNPDDISLGGARRDITVMFTDIRGFTTISELADPQDLMEQMTEYFNGMVGAVFRFHGLVDKFTGDGLMALYGCFGEETRDHARDAVLSALTMRSLLPALNERWAQSGRPTFRMGIGVHCGSAIVGNMGSDRKWNFTAAGDTVNTASRIGELCKKHADRWETTILVSEDVVARLGGLAELERIGEVPIRGRRQLVGIYAVLGLVRREGQADASQQHETEGGQVHWDPTETADGHAGAT